MSLHIISAPSFLRTLHRCPGWVFATFFPLFPLSHLTWIKDLKFRKQTLPCNEKVFILPRRLTWNLKMMVGKMIFLYQGCLVKFHVHLPGGNPHPFDKMVDSLSFGSVRFSKALYFQARTGAPSFCQGHRCSEVFSQRSEESTEDSPKRRTTILDFRRSLGERLIACRVSKAGIQCINQKFLVWQHDTVTYVFELGCCL